MPRKKLTIFLNALIGCGVLACAGGSWLTFSARAYAAAAGWFLGALFLAWSWRWQLYGKIALFFTSLAILSLLYLSNLVLALRAKSEPDAHYYAAQRLKIAREAGRPFDTRSIAQVVDDLRARGVDAYPAVYPFLFTPANGLVDHGRRFFPLGGISRKTTVYCNECGDYTIYEADEHGFNNPPGVWSQKETDLFLLGDSFAQGACVKPAESLDGLLRAAGKSVVNVGFGGNGPLLELAGIVEYARYLQPKKVIWLYYEGNDLTDLANEKKAPLLARYLAADGYQQDLISRQDAIDRAWIKVTAAEQQESVVPPPKTDPLEFLKPLELKELKRASRRLTFLFQEYVYRENPTLFSRIMAKADRMVQSWGGKLYFVYLPSFFRYDHKAKVYPFNQKDLILASVRALGIPAVDFDQVIRQNGDPLSCFPFRTNGHYNPKGYALLARTILDSW